MKRQTTKLRLIHKQSNNKGCAGAAMVEFALTLPLLMLLFFGVYDFGRWLQLYFSANRVAYEAVRFVSSTPGLNERSVQSVRERVDVLVQINDLPSSTQMSEVVLPEDSANNTVSVTISAPFEPTFLPFEMRVRSRAISPYLFSDGS